MLHSVAIGPPLPQTITLVEKIEEFHDYNALGNVWRIVTNTISMHDLSDLAISELVARLRKSQNIESRDAPLIIVEGITDYTYPRLDKGILVVVKYNFARNEPLIEVPGKYRGPKPEQNIIRFSLLDHAESLSFVNTILLKNIFGGLYADYRYTGQYKIWPDNPELRTREIPI
ncbi:hypothetical protein HYX00_05440 [Candidatus Woesearchaeota archaeon]|nr:hypothetical protein [Candidatus Woesearchaeota archaeon]